MKQIISIIIFVSLFVYSDLMAQSVPVSGPGYPIGSEFDCSSTLDFTDGVGNYTPNRNDTITLCPSLQCDNGTVGGTKMTVIFSNDAGFTWAVDASDMVYVYDGPSTSSPLLGAVNTTTDPTGETFIASWGNPSGCLTIVFITDGANEAAGWNAATSCGFPAQPYTPHVEAYINGVGPNALNPVDTGYVDVCFGDSILFVAKPIFPYGCESIGNGYTQSVESVDYEWYISDGGVYPNNDSIWFTPPARSGYLVDLKISDEFPLIERLLCKVRVSQQPLFTGTGPLEDTVCLGENTILIGGVTQTDTVGVNIPGGTFQLGGSFAGLTYLPDGNGDQYEAPIQISGFPAGATIGNSQDLNQVCITMEHSYLGDLEIALECPNGTQVTLLNSYSPGFIPLGTSGGGTYMGDPVDNTTPGVTGEGWEYCFSSVFNTWGDYPTEYGNGNTIPAPNFGGGGASLNPNGVYLPEEDFNTFAGCPVNGQWTIIVQDNIGQDDGYIFEWGLYFDPSFFPGSGAYQNIVIEDEWLDHPTIVSGQNDTLIVIQPNTTGYTDYTYVVTDDFGCVYDTTVSLYVLPRPVIFEDTIGCFYNYFVNGTISYDGGVWSAADTAIHFMPNANVENPLIHTSTPGTYTVTYTDNACNTPVTAEIYFPDYPWTHLPDTNICEGSVLVLNAPNENVDATQYAWSNGAYGPSVELSEPGFYEVTLTNVCHSSTESFTLGIKNCFLDAPNVISLASGSLNSTWYPDYYGIKDYEIVITNRWGNVVFKCDDKINLCNWNGKDMGGAFVEEGTYFYLINAKTEGDEEIQKHGFIQVVK